MKKKLAMVLTGVAVCSLLMMGCQGKETETQTDGVQTETTDPAADAAEPEVEPIPETETGSETEGTDNEAAQEGEASPSPEAGETNTETDPEGTESGEETSAEDGEEQEKLPEEEKKAGE